MKLIFLVPTGYQTNRGPKALTRDGVKQMETVARKLSKRLRPQMPLFFSFTSEVDIQSRQIITDALRVTREMERELFQEFNFMRDLTDPISQRLLIMNIRSECTPDSSGALVILTKPGCIPLLDPAIQHLLWGGTPRLIRNDAIQDISWHTMSLRAHQYFAERFIFVHFTTPRVAGLGFL